jgi:predicted membrane channel-forming protein YqfA (hemolysin III family)
MSKLKPNIKRNLEIYWMLIMSAIALIICSTFLEGWMCLSFLFIAGFVYIIAQVFFWWARWKQIKRREEIIGSH